MNLKNKIIIKYYFKYLILLIIFKNIHYLLPVNLEQLNNYFWVFIPISYLVVKYMFIYKLQEDKLTKKELLWPIVIGYTILNLILCMPVFYNLFVLIFLLILKESDYDQDTDKYIKEYFEKNGSTRK